MGMKTSNLAILFAAICFSFSNAWAGATGSFADEVPANRVTESYGKIQKNTPSKSASASNYVVSCPVSTLSYCLKDNIRAQKCVTATSDSQAASRCGTRSYWYVGSGNKYGVTSSFANVYMCSNDGSKKEICLSNASTSKLSWESVSNSDGNCYQTDNNEKKICDFTAMAHTVASDVAATKVNCVDGKINNPNTNDKTNQCICDSQNGYIDGPNNTCKPTNAAAVASSSALVKCVDDRMAAAQQCVTQANETKKICEKHKGENSTVDGISTAAQTIFGGLQAKGAADARSGAASSSQLCAIASLASSGTASLLSGFREDCSSDQQKCAKVCSEYTSKKLEEICGSMAKTLINNYEMSDSDKRYLANNQTELNKALEPADTYCSVTAKEENDLLTSALGNALKSQAAAQNCVCQTTTSAGDCMPSSEACLANPSLNGCSTNPYAINCSMGASDYSTPNCVCLRDPSSPSCKAALTANVNAMGSGIKSNGSDASNFAGGGTLGDTGGFDGAIDLSSPRGAFSGDLSGKSSSLNPMGEPLSGGGGSLGGGGGGGGGSSEKPAAGPEEEQSALGGAFSSLKSMMGSVFGGGKNAGNGSTKSSTGSTFDPSKFSNPRGLRGIASGTGMGSKNMDIFKMIKTRHVDRDKAGTFFDPSYK